MTTTEEYKKDLSFFSNMSTFQRVYIVHKSTSNTGTTAEPAFNRLEGIESVELVLDEPLGAAAGHE